MITQKNITAGKPDKAALCLLLACVLFVGLVVKSARAGDSRQQHQPLIRHSASVAVGLIGTIESLAPTAINGQEVQGKQMLWRGDELQLLTDTAVHAHLNSVGEITLSQRAIARLSASLINAQDDTGHRILIASLTQGSMVVRLEEQAKAYIEACDLAIIASGGASFRVSVKKGDAVIDRVNGTVDIQSRPKRELKTRFDDPANPTRHEFRVERNKRQDMAGKMRKIEHRSTGQEFLFVSLPGRNSNQVPSTEEAAPGRLLKFELDPPTIGTVDPPTKITDQNGEARVTFIAGPNAGRGTITARIADYDSATERIAEERPATITVYKPRFWTTTKIVIASIAAAAIIGGVISRGKKPLTKQGPPIPVP